MNLLSIRNLEVEFDGAGGPQRVIHGIGLDLGAGEVLAVVGESGSGKSVTAAAILGLLPERDSRARGSVRFEGRELLGLPEAALNGVRGAGIGIIFQNSLSSLDPSFRIGEQMTEGLRFRRRLDAAAARAEAARWLDRVGIRDVQRVLRAYPHELSGGMRQRVMIAMAVMGRPKLLIADEPTTALDPTIQKQILDLLRDINREEGTALLVITHDFGVVSYLSDRVAVMRAGVVVEQGATRDVLAAPAHPYTAALVRAVPDSAEIRRAQRQLAAAPVSAATPASPVASPIAPADARDDADAVLVLEQVSRSFRLGGGFWGKGTEVAAVRPTDLRIRRGEILGLIGESGSGKSTLARLAARLVDPSGGTIRAHGVDVTRLRGPALKAFRRRVQFVFQDSGASLNPRRQIGAQLADALTRLDVAASARAARDLAVQALERVGLAAAHLERYPHEFSGGQRQRIGIARALAAQPEFVILDEPTSALDVSIQAQVLDLLRELRAELNLTFLFIGHDLAVIESLCDRVAVMERGTIVETFNAGALHEHTRHPVTRRLLEAVLPLRRSAGEDRRSAAA
ncbi:ABC transporter ATP-binding protein [Cupriavidus sp. WS]|uniref:dipeptide ABC transporter ATP-binding protein n=1 Tax=Cupriavidus sp. WS TaxID=1312922 RepID=UPI0003753514|nr:ABC transporter ATP-binding protein [Cupriavidus sp. WS]